jgi:hypothetical protein
MKEIIYHIFADVTQCISPKYKINPKKYKNCQLIAEKNGGYMQFLHKPTNKILKIAINSHIYRPI